MNVLMRIFSSLSSQMKMTVLPWSCLCEDGADDVYFGSWMSYFRHVNTRATSALVAERPRSLPQQSSYFSKGAVWTEDPFKGLGLRTEKEMLQIHINRCQHMVLPSYLRTGVWNKLAIYIVITIYMLILNTVTEILSSPVWPRSDFLHWLHSVIGFTAWIYLLSMTEKLTEMSKPIVWLMVAGWWL